MKKKVIIIIVVLALVSIIFGVVFMMLQDKKKTTDKEISKVLTNTSENLKNSHCLDNLCIKTLNITYNKGQGKIEFQLQNTSQENVSGNYLKLVFDNNQDLSYIYRYDDMKPEDVVSVVIEFQDEDLVKASDYEIKLLSVDELNEFKNGEKGSFESK